jgi:cell wall-associated NlpC family hydrolase
MGGATNRATLTSEARFLVAALIAAACLVAAARPADAGAQSSGPQVQGEFIATLALASVGQFPYCLGGGDIYGPTPGWEDPDSDGSYSTCWGQKLFEPNKYGFDSTGLTRYIVYRGTGKQVTRDSYQAKFGGGVTLASKADLLPGDVVYFDYDAANGLDAIDRAGIYVGNGEVVSAVSEALGIRREPIDWYEEERGLHYVGAVRFWEESRGPIGDADLISSPQIGEIRLGGWATDPDAKTAPVNLYAYVGGYSFTPGTELHNLGPADGERPDVAAADPDAGAFHGIDATFHTDKTGKQLVCLYATNIGEGSNSYLGCDFVSVGDPSPAGVFARTSAPSPGTIRIVGAASDPEASSPLTVGAYVGGLAGSPGVEGPALGLADGPDPELAGQRFDFTFATTKVGWVPVCVYAFNVGTGHDTLLGCKEVLVVPEAFVVPTPQQTSPAAKAPAVVRRHRHRRHHRHRHHRHHHHRQHR